MAEKKGEEWEEYNNAVQWTAVTVLVSLIVSIFLAIFSLPLGYLIGTGVSQESLDIAGRFIKTIFNNPSYLTARYISWFKQLSNYHGPFSFSLWLPILPFITLPVGLTVGLLSNPYRFQSNIHGSARIATEKDINNMRLSRVRSPKALSDLISVKGSLYSTKLAAIKEINSIKKNILDLNMKSKKTSEDENQASMAASLALQQMIEGDARDSLSDSEYRAMARGSMISRQSGEMRSEIPSYERNAQDDIDELEAEREYSAMEKSEGDLYIQYENMNVQTYAEVDENDQVVRLVAKDRDGNEIPDYPMPGINEGTFTVHEDLGTVTDSFHRNYILEKV